MRFLALALLSGCASSPYAEVGLGWQVDGQTDYWLQQDRDWQCSHGPLVEAEIGLEMEGNWKVGYHHQSWLMCGGPFGDGKPEVYQDDIRITKKFGGK